jgi:hypothetical protein
VQPVNGEKRLAVLVRVMGGRFEYPLFARSRS